MSRFTTSITVHAPRTRVFSTFIDETKLTKWVRELQQIKLTKGKKRTVGATFMSTFSDDGNTVRVTQKILRLERNTLFTFSTEDSHAYSETHVRFTHRNGKTRVRADVEIHGKGLWALLVPILKGQIQKRQQENLRRFKELVEG